MKFLLLGGGYNIYPSIYTPRWWDFSHSEAKTWFLRWWDFSHLENRVCTLRNGIFPHSKVSTQTCLRAFLDSPTRFETLHYGIAITRSPPLCRGIFSSQSPVWCSTDGTASTWNTNTYRLPSSEPTCGWIPDTFFLPSFFHIPMIGFFGDSSIDGISLTREGNFTDGFTLTLEVQDGHRIGSSIRERRTKLSMG